MGKRVYDGSNWNKPEDDVSIDFLAQNQTQFWMPEEIPLANDIEVWETLSPEVKDTYAKNLQVLTFLDTYQGDIGMPVVSRSVDDKNHQQKAVLNFMAMMENAVHAKSYSNIFMTYLTDSEIDELFKWGEENQSLQNILQTIVGLYDRLDEYNYIWKFRNDSIVGELTKEDYEIVKWQAMVASVFLETYLFYSGFYYPLYFYGQGVLMQPGEIINLILRDEQVHGLYIGYLAQQIYDTFNEELKEVMYEWMIGLVETLYRYQTTLMEELYDPVGLTEDVKKFVRYNANKAFMNLGFDPYFEEEEVNPIVIKGLNTESKIMDNFSMKGNGYQKITSEPISKDFLDSLDEMENIVDVYASYKNEETKNLLVDSAYKIEGYIQDVSNTYLEVDSYIPISIQQRNRKLLVDLLRTFFIVYPNSSEWTKDNLVSYLDNDDYESINRIKKYLVSTGEVDEYELLNRMFEYFDSELYGDILDEDDDEIDEESALTDIEVSNLYMDTSDLRKILIYIVEEMSKNG